MGVITEHISRGYVDHSGFWGLDTTGTGIVRVDVFISE